VADRIKVVVAEMLDRRIKDPRLGFVTVTDVRVTGDTQHASVFYTVLGDAEQQASSAAALESAKGVLRAEVGKQLGMRHTPTLEFTLDALPGDAHTSRSCSNGRASRTQRSPATPRARSTPVSPTPTACPRSRWRTSAGDRRHRRRRQARRPHLP
jgi:ribosome-binding factor A